MQLIKAAERLPVGLSGAERLHTLGLSRHAATAGPGAFLSGFGNATVKEKKGGSDPTTLSAAQLVSDLR